MTHTEFYSHLQAGRAQEVSAQLKDGPGWRNWQRWVVMGVMYTAGRGGLTAA